MSSNAARCPLRDDALHGSSAVLPARIATPLPLAAKAPRPEYGRPVAREFLLPLPRPLERARGGPPCPVTVGLRLTGPEHAPVIVVLGGISADRRAVRLSNEGAEGWWQPVLGPEGADLATRYRVLTFDWLGGPDATTADDGALDAVDTADQASLLAAILDALAIDSVFALVSASYGGMVAQQFCLAQPGRAGRALIMACAHRPEAMAVARRQLQKRILRLDGVDEAEALALARGLAMTTYRSPAEFESRFAGPDGQASLENYLDHQGRKFARRFDRAAYLRLLDSIDRHAIDPARLTTPTTLLGFSSDELCPPERLRAFARQAPGVRRCRILDTTYGHDAFLCERKAVARTLEHFLEGAHP